MVAWKPKTRGARPSLAPVAMGAGAAALSTALWIGAGFAGEDVRLLLVYTAGALCPLALALLCGKAWLLAGRFGAAGQQAQSTAGPAGCALRDPLTGLVNQAGFEDHVGRAIARARRGRLAVGVLCIDLDRFKQVNDTLGHTAGDDLLREVARRIEGCLRSADIVARWGGDEFLVALPDLTDRSGALRIADKLADALRLPFEVGGHSLVVSAAIGVSLYPDDGQNCPALCENADRAMYRAKAEGRSGIACYTQELGDMARERLELEQHLRSALDKGQMVLFYQPQFDLKTRKLAALEALLRWKHPERGMLRPDRFLPMAEDSGLILPIGLWALGAVCRQVRQMRESGCPPVKIAVNVSRPQFFRADFEEAVKNAVRESGIEPSSLVLELAEGMVMKDFGLSRQKIEKLRKFGVRISIDDFGAGGASLRLLQKLPIDSLKIDRSFIHDLGASFRSLQLVDSIIRLARGLGVAAIAGGVESIPQLMALRSLGCDQAQGYLFGMPLPAAEIGRWMTRERMLCPVRPRPVMPSARASTGGAHSDVSPLPGAAPPAQGTLETSLSVTH